MSGPSETGALDAGARPQAEGVALQRLSIAAAVERAASAALSASLGWLAGAADFNRKV